jgi:hypothetical protein
MSVPRAQPLQASTDRRARFKSKVMIQNNKKAQIADMAFRGCLSRASCCLLGSGRQEAVG